MKPGDRVSIDVVWHDGSVSRLTGELIVITDGQAYVESDLGPVSGAAETLEAEPEDD